MKYKYALLITCFLSFLATTNPVSADSVYSVSSLKILCGDSENTERDLDCKLYLHGVVETWMMKDLVGVEPMRYQSRVKSETFCETINKVSDDEWLRIVRINLASMKPGFASIAVIEVLATNLCNQPPN